MSHARKAAAYYRTRDALTFAEQTAICQASRITEQSKPDERRAAWWRDEDDTTTRTPEERDALILWWRAYVYAACERSAQRVPQVRLIPFVAASSAYNVPKATRLVQLREALIAHRGIQKYAAQALGVSTRTMSYWVRQYNLREYSILSHPKPPAA